MNPDAHTFIPKTKTNTTTITTTTHDIVMSPPHSPTHFFNNINSRVGGIGNSNINNFNDYFICNLCQRNSLKREVTIVCNSHPLICFKCTQRSLLRQIGESVMESLICPCYGCSRILTDPEIRRTVDTSAYSFFISRLNRIPSSPIISPSPPPTNFNSSRSPSPHHKTSEFIFVKGATNITPSTLYGGNSTTSNTTTAASNTLNGSQSPTLVPGGIYSVNSENFAANVSSSMAVAGFNKKSELVQTPDRFRKLYCNSAGYDTVAETQFIQELPDDFWNSQSVYGF